MTGKYVDFESTITGNEKYEKIIDVIRKERKYIVDTIRSFIKIKLLDTTGDNIFTDDNIFLDIEYPGTDWWDNFIYCRDPDLPYNRTILGKIADMTTFEESIEFNKIKIPSYCIQVAYYDDEYPSSGTTEGFDWFRFIQVPRTEVDKIVSHIAEQRAFRYFDKEYRGVTIDDIIDDSKTFDKIEAKIFTYFDRGVENSQETYIHRTEISKLINSHPFRKDNFIGFGYKEASIQFKRDRKDWILDIPILNDDGYVESFEEIITTPYVIDIVEEIYKGEKLFELMGKSDYHAVIDFVRTEMISSILNSNG